MGPSMVITFQTKPFSTSWVYHGFILTFHTCYAMATVKSHPRRLVATACGMYHPPTPPHLNINKHIRAKNIPLSLHEFLKWEIYPSVPRKLYRDIIEKKTTSWWFQPIWKPVSQIGSSSPRIGMTIKHIRNHQPEKHESLSKHLYPLPWSP